MKRHPHFGGCLCCCDAATITVRACSAYWIRAAVVKAEPGAHAPEAQPSAVADSAVKLAAEEPVHCAVAAPVRCEAAFYSCPADWFQGCSAADALARVDSVAEYCLVPHSDGRSALAVRTDDFHPCSLPSGYSEPAGWEQADLPQVECCRDDCCQADFPAGCYRHDYSPVDYCLRHCDQDGCCHHDCPDDCRVEQYRDDC